MPCLCRIRPSTFGLASNASAAALARPKPGRTIGHDAELLAVDVARALLAVGLVDQAEQRGGVGVIDELVRHERVQQRLDRRVGRAGIDQVGALHAHHLLVGEVVVRAQLAQRRRAAPPGMPAGSIAAMSAPVPLTHSTSVSSPARSAHAHLDRGVAAAVQNQLGIAAEQARGVDAQRQVARDARLGVAIDGRLGVAIDPAALHRARLWLARRPGGAWPTSRSGAACWRRRRRSVTTGAGSAAPAAADRRRRAVAEHRRGLAHRRAAARRFRGGAVGAGEGGCAATGSGRGAYEARARA